MAIFGFDPRAVAVLSTAEGVPNLANDVGQGSAAQVVEAGPGLLVLDVSSERDGLLVVSQPFYPGWQARIDQEPAAIHRVNHLLQGVSVGAGTHRVELSYHQSPLVAIVSTLVLALCFAGLVLGRRV